MMAGRSICFVFLPNKEGQVGQPTFCLTSVFLEWEEVSKNQGGGSVVWNVSSLELTVWLVCGLHGYTCSRGLF